MRKIVLLTILIALAVSCGDGSREKKGAASTDGKEQATGTRVTPGKKNVANDKDDSGTVSLTGEDYPAGTSPEGGIELPADKDIPSGAVLIASDIVTEVIIRPDPDGDPWEMEKVAGYKGDVLVDGIFSRIYDGTLTAFDYHSGEPLSPADVKKIEGEFKNDRTKIGKLSFTEDWYYFPGENRIEKRARSVTFGYELYNNIGKVYAYKAAFRADLQ